MGLAYRQLAAVGATIERNNRITMPKQKTHKGMKKRYKLTASGLVKHRKRGRGHLLSGKTSARKRHLRQDAVVAGVWASHIVEGLRPGL